MRYTHLAERDILDIWLEIAMARPRTADRTLDNIEARCAQLDEFPELGPSRPDIFREARVLVIDRWLAIYQIDANGPQIVRVVDAARDLRNLIYHRE